MYSFGHGAYMRLRMLKKLTLMTKPSYHEQNIYLSVFSTNNTNDKFRFLRLTEMRKHITHNNSIVSIFQNESRGKVAS